MPGDSVYNPLDKVNLGRSVAEAMLEREVKPLGSLARFNGAGIYAIYYTGDFEAYQPIAEANRDDKYAAPIYVGKAIPPGARQGNVGLSQQAGPELFGRLSEHAGSVRAAQNLRIEDFRCRYLIVDDIWIPLGEALLIAKFGPLWNRLLAGFGNHNPGSGRFQGMISRWDVMHPGREWAPRFQPRPESQQQLIEEVKAHLAVAPTPNPHMLGPDSE